MPINPAPVTGPALQARVDFHRPVAGPSGGFTDVLRTAIDRVNQLDLEAGAEIRRLLAGETEDWHRSLLAVQKAELAFEMLLQTRNKVVQAYQEIMRMPM